MQLKAEIVKKGGQTTGFSLGLGLESHMSECFSPIKVKGGLEGIDTARSNFF